MTSLRAKTPNGSNQKGFTLIELLVVTGITAMIMLTATSMFATFLLSSARTNTRRQLQAQGNEAIRRIEFVIRNAADVITPAACDGTGVDTLVMTTIDNNSNTLAFASATISENGQRLISDTADVVRITTPSTIPIFRCYTSGSTKYIDVAFRLQIASGTTSQDFQTTVQLRNTSF